MNEDCLKLTTYLGERDRAGSRILADELTDIFDHRELRTSLLMRGITGFGLKQHLRTDRLLTLSEDLPLISVAVDTRSRIEGALEDVSRLRFAGLLTLERATLLTDHLDEVRVPWGERAETKLTAYIGRHERLAGAPGYQSLVALLRRSGMAGATVILGVDGTFHGVRQRATLLGRNTMVPLMVIAVGDSRRIVGALAALNELLPRPVLTLERVEVLKRDGVSLRVPRELPRRDRSGLQVWQKLMVYSSESARYDGEPLHQRLIRELRQAGAAGATSLRGIWGYHGEQEPHGDRLWQLRRHVPVVTVIVDEPERIRRWFGIVDRLTVQTGLVTSEIVPAFRATAPEIRRGGLRLAQRLPH